LPRIPQIRTDEEQYFGVYIKQTFVKDFYSTKMINFLPRLPGCVMQTGNSTDEERYFLGL
jgi:hypothetical protein